MSQTPPVAPDVLPPAPTATVPTGFALTMDNFLASFAGFRTQLLALATNAYNNCVDAFNSATSAAASAVTATTQATAAVSGVNAIAWVSGTTYAAGNVRYSPANFLTYRRITAGAGTTDPSLDPTNWLIPTQLPFAFMKISHRLATSTAGGASVALDITQTRAFNTTEANTITGASLASNIITLPAGTYKYRVRAPAYGVGLHQAFLYNSSDATYAGVGGQNTASGSGTTTCTDSWVSGQFTIAATKNFTVRHYTANAVATTGLGLAASVSGQVEVYSEAEFTKVA